MDERKALEDLRRTEAKLAEYAERNGLLLRPELTWPGQPLPEEQFGPIRHASWSLSGELPGGARGRLRHQAVFGAVMGMKVAGQHTIMVCRIPEAVGYLPMLSVRAEGLEPSLFYWAGDRRPRVDVGGFESLELDRRYIVEVAKGQDEVWLRRLFPPSFIDWLAASTPVDFGFRLNDGVFTCECPQYRGQHRADGEVDFEHLDLLAGCGGRAASRIRDEVREKARGTGGGASAPASAAAHLERSGARRTGRIVGLLAKLAKAGMVDSSITGFGERHGLDPKPVSEFHANHILLPLPGTATDVLIGTLPGTAIAGEIAWLEFSSDVDLQRNSLAVVIDTGRTVPSLWVDSDDVTIPGIGGELPQAVRELAAEGELGVSSEGTKICVYATSPPGDGGWIGGEEIADLCPRAAAIAEALSGATAPAD